ncbi:MAG: hypothetical protein AMS24_03930 [Chlamydiae bacterium SM23_39]|nr:MAG: hypothetical protein AMS24_03930 [Chlamydiae bacterium SM23_39]
MVIKYNPTFNSVILLNENLELESTQCSKFLYFIKENSKNPQFKSSKKEEIIEIKKDKKYE